jgi:hypothetical protein
MPEIKSPITNKTIRGPVMRDLTVTDESGYTPPPQQPPLQRPHRREEVPQFDPQAMREFESSMQPPRPAVQMNDLTDEEKHIIELKKAKREGKERLSDGAKRRIEMLIGMTRLSKEVDIEGQIYKVQTLSSRDLRDVMVAVSEFDGTVQFMFEHRKQILARSLTVLAGVDITQFLNSYELQDRLDFIELMDNALLLRLYSEYAKLDKEANDKYALKTEAEVVAVLDDLKK